MHSSCSRVLPQVPSDPFGSSTNSLWAGSLRQAQDLRQGRRANEQLSRSAGEQRAVLQE